MRHPSSRMLGLVVVGSFALPALENAEDCLHRFLNRSYPSSELHLSLYHRDPADRARILRKAERRRLRRERRERLAEARRAPGALQASGPGSGTALAGSPPATAQSRLALAAPLAEDSQDDDSGLLKKRRRKKKAQTRWWRPEERHRLLPEAGILPLVRARVETREARLRRDVAPLQHFGSGPCHSIPRPREDTACPDPIRGGAAA